MFVDSHCHLDYPGLVEREDEVLANAAAAGVNVMQTIATGLDRVDAVLAIARRHKQVVCAVGVHPHNAGEGGLNDAAPLLAYVDDPNVVAFGETGLDYHYDRSPRDAQARSFRAHIDACRQTGLPLIVHTRDADEDTAAILKEEYERGPFTGVIHCYSSSQALGEAALDLGLYLGIGGILTFNGSRALRDIVREMPLDRLLLETDAPYLAPPPHRGKTNEPSYIPIIAKHLAETLREPLPTVEQVTTENFLDLFSKARAALP